MTSRCCFRNAFRLYNVSRLRANNATLPSLMHCCHRTETSYAARPTNSRRREKYLKELFERRIEVGPDQERHPSTFGCWNYDAELFAFGKRFNEDFKEDVLKEAFTSRLFAEREQEKQEELGLGLEIDVHSNERLAHMGRSVSSAYIKGYLRFVFKNVPEEGICAVHDYLMSDQTLLHIAQNLGFKDLIQSTVYPPSDEENITALLAVVGALRESQVTRAESAQDMKTAGLFVGDFILPQLVGKDISEIWHIKQPMAMLRDLLASDGGQLEPESRLLWASAKHTLMSVYMVGIYVQPAGEEKLLLSKSPGETMQIAEEMAAREAIKSFLGLEDSRPPLPLGNELRGLEFPVEHVEVTARLVKEVVEEVIDSEEKVTSAASQ